MAVMFHRPVYLYRYNLYSAANEYPFKLACSDCFCCQPNPDKPTKICSRPIRIALEEGEFYGLIHAPPSKTVALDKGAAYIRKARNLDTRDPAGGESDVDDSPTGEASAKTAASYDILRSV